MNDLVLFSFLGLLIFAQFLTCIFAKKMWLRWLPIFFSVFLIVLLIVLYFINDKTNWGFIILFTLMGIILLGQSLIIFLNYLIRKLIKN